MTGALAFALGRLLLAPPEVAITGRTPTQVQPEGVVCAEEPTADPADARRPSDA